VANPDGCKSKQRFAERIPLAYYIPVGDQGLMYGDEADGTTITLMYAKVAGGKQWPAAGAYRIFDGVDPTVAVVRTPMQHLLFSVSQGTAQQNGIYLFGPLP
jgi:hypothetical protein